MVIVAKKELTKQEWCEQEKADILSKITEFDIVMGFWPGGKEFALNKAISSPFRGDGCPSFIIGTKYGPITYKDMGDYNFRGDVWKFVEQIEGLQKFTQVLAKIRQRFNLSCLDEVVEKSKIITWEQPKLVVKPPPLFQVSVRKFNRTELAWWNLYHQDISDLKREQIYAPAEIWRNRQKLQQADMTFCYFVEELGKWKIYRPLAPKRTKNTPIWNWKWDSSLPFNYVESLEKMKGPVGICGKSRKDRMVLRKTTGIDAICSVQAEDPSAITDEALYHIWSNCRHRYIIADADKKGKEFSWWMTTQHGYNHFNTPDNELDNNINDVADYARYYGIEALRSKLKEKMVI